MERIDILVFPPIRPMVEPIGLAYWRSANSASTQIWAATVEYGGEAEGHTPPHKHLEYRKYRPTSGFDIIYIYIYIYDGAGAGLLALN